MAITMARGHTKDFSKVAEWQAQGLTVVDDHGSTVNENYKSCRERGGEHEDSFMYLEVLYEGRVFYEYERNGYDDSDFYAVVWDGDEDGEFKHICFRSTRGWSYNNGCRADATPEVREWARRKVEASLRESYRGRALDEAREVRKGDQVTVTGGRKLPKGTVAEVKWVGVNEWAPKYATRDEKVRLGLKVDGQEKLVYVSGNQVVVDPQTVIDRVTGFETLDKMAERDSHSARALGGRGY